MGGSIENHYDSSIRFYEYLENLRSYSCNWWLDKYGNVVADNNNKAAVNKWKYYADKLQLNSSMRVLELGCGWGHMAAYFHEIYGCEIVGLNVSQGQIDYARETHSKDIIFTKLAWQDLAGRGDFDVVIADGCLVHARGQQDEFFKRVSDHLKSDGTALIKEMHLKHILRGRSQAMCAQIGQTFDMTGEYRLYREDRESARRAGLVVDHEQIDIKNYVLTLEEWMRRMEEDEEVMRQIDSDKYDLDLATWITVRQMMLEDIFTMDVMLCRHA